MFAKLRFGHSFESMPCDFEMRIAEDDAGGGEPNVYHDPILRSQRAHCVSGSPAAMAGPSSKKTRARLLLFSAVGIAVLNAHVILCQCIIRVHCLMHMLLMVFACGGMKEAKISYIGGTAFAS